MTLKIKILGDQHLGRQFIHGVSLARRGEREMMMRNQFAREYENIPEGTDMHVNVGDVFDKAVVSYDTILFASVVVNHAARKNPKTRFVILKGNHDLFRDLERASAFDLFAKLVFHNPNVHIVDGIYTHEGHAFFGYNAITPIAEVVEKAKLDGIHTCWFHCDTNGFGSEHNVLPTKQLAAKGILTAFTGHVHKPDTFNRDGVAVTVVGSMQPLAFGEQANTDLYVEHTLSSLKSATDLKDKVVRVLLAADELLDDEVDCLQLVVKRQSSATEDAPLVTMEEFDMEALFKKAFASAGVSDTVTNSLLGSYNDKRLIATD